MRPLPKKGQALLAYLALQRGRPVPREQLADLLWGRSGGEQARKSLRQCLMVARAALKGFAEQTRSRLKATAFRWWATGILPLTPRVSTCSAHQRRKTISKPPSLSIVTSFSAGLQIASAPFDEWVLMQRRRLASAMSDVLHRLAWRANGPVKAAADRSRERLTKFDPLREDGHRLLMRTLQLLGAAARRSSNMLVVPSC